jgi:tetratricopeptide (TPR) repeat protein
MGIKKKVSSIILLFSLSVNVMLNTFAFTHDEMEKYEKLFKEGEYERIITELSPAVEAYEWNRPKSNLSESTIEIARNLVADSYRMLKQFTNASLWYADSVDGYFNSYARYCFEIFKRISILEGRELFYWECVPFLHYDGRLGEYPENVKSLRWILAKIFDKTSLEQKKQYFTEMASYDKNNDWVSFLTGYYAGESTLDELLSSTPEEYMDIVCAYAGFMLELEGKATEARELYKKALNQTNSTHIEQLLAANRLGEFALRMIILSQI